MRKISLALTAATLCLATATPALAQRGMQPGSMPMRGDMMNPTEARQFVMMAGASDLFEIQSSRLALQRSRNPQVRRFAQMLITHHTQTTQSVMAAARRARVMTPPPRLMPMQQRMMTELRAARGNNFDSVYLSQQVPAHEMALQLHQNYASNGDRPPLRQAASTAVPIVTRHLEEARQMAGRRM